MITIVVVGPLRPHYPQQRQSFRSSHIYCPTHREETLDRHLLFHPHFVTRTLQSRPFLDPFPQAVSCHLYQSKCEQFAVKNYSSCYLADLSYPYQLISVFPKYPFQLKSVHQTPSNHGSFPSIEVFKFELDFQIQLVQLCQLAFQRAKIHFTGSKQASRQLLKVYLVTLLLLPFCRECHLVLSHPIQKLISSIR